MSGEVSHGPKHMKAYTCLKARTGLNCFLLHDISLLNCISRWIHNFKKYLKLIICYACIYYLPPAPTTTTVQIST
jgi:hypothetical protein